MLQLRVPLHNGGIGVLSVVNVGFTTIDTVALHTCHAHNTRYSIIVGLAWYRWYTTIDTVPWWGGPALSKVQIHGTHTTPGTAPWWGQRGTDGTVPLTQQHHGRASVVQMVQYH